MTFNQDISLATTIPKCQSWTLTNVEVPDGEFETTYASGFEYRQKRSSIGTEEGIIFSVDNFG